MFSFSQFSPGLVTTDGYSSGHSAYYNSSGSTGNSFSWTHLPVAEGSENGGFQHCVCVCQQATSTVVTLHIRCTIRTVTQQTRLPTQVGWQKRSRYRRPFETACMTEVRKFCQMTHSRGVGRRVNLILCHRPGRPARSSSPVRFSRARCNWGGPSAEAEEVRALNGQTGRVRRKIWWQRARMRGGSWGETIKPACINKTPRIRTEIYFFLFIVDHLWGHWSPNFPALHLLPAFLFLWLLEWDTMKVLFKLFTQNIEVSRSNAVEFVQSEFRNTKLSALL